MKEMNIYKNTEGVFLSKRRFALIVRDITYDAADEEYRWQRGALDALQYASEGFISDLFTMAQLAAIHARRETVMVRDMQLVYEVHNVASDAVLHNLKHSLQDSAKKDGIKRSTKPASTAKSKPKSKYSKKELRELVLKEKQAKK